VSISLIKLLKNINVSLKTNKKNENDPNFFSIGQKMFLLIRGKKNFKKKEENLKNNEK
jgi:hypothetical protein